MGHARIVAFSLAVVWLGITRGGLAEAPPRETLSLNGVWECATASALEEVPVPTDGWEPADVPGVIYGHDYRRAWFRRTFQAPAAWHGQRVVLRFGGVKYNSRVLVNGEHAGGCFNGYDPFECDITDAVRYGGDNVLLVEVRDWTGVFSDGEPIDFARGSGQRELRDVPRDRVLAPIGGRWFHYGIWDDVALAVMPRTYLDAVRVFPSVRTRRIDIHGYVRRAADPTNAGGVTARIHAYDGAPRDGAGQWPTDGAVVWEGRAEVRAPDGQFAFAIENPPLKLWWPHDPCLYVLEVSLPDGDRWTERIGYRELWAEGPDFYLNGVQTHLLATSWWPPHPPRPRDEIRETMAAIKRMHAACFRTHTQPWRRRWYEVADEMGLLMIPEGAIWNDDMVYRVKDPAFWRNYQDHLEAMVRHLFNHPSVVMWSLENEMHGGRMRDGTPQEEFLASMGDAVKALDPTRLITYESDGDPGGAADVVGLHYPNEYPHRRLWPNDAYWIGERPTLWRGNMFWDAPEFEWNREKPLYIGEFLWAPAPDPSNNTLFWGDEAYGDFREYHNRAKALSWRMQILAYRYAGVSGISPWTVIEHGPLSEKNSLWCAQRDFYRPLAAFVREYDTRFYAGETVDRTVFLFNDTMAGVDGATFRWALLRGEEALTEGNETLSMPSGARAERSIAVPMPEVSERSTFTLRLTLYEGGIERFRDNVPVEVFPRRMLEAPEATVYLYDPVGGLTTALGGGAQAFTRLESLDEWHGDGVLAVGPDALRDVSQEGGVPVIGAARNHQDAIAGKVAQGGRVLLLEQARGVDDWIPVQTAAQESTMAFIQRPHHPVFRGLRPEDLKWWRGEHLVSLNEPSRPVTGGGKALAVTGTDQGISHAPLLEIPHGNGVWLLCQLRIVSKLESEPVAARLFQNMLDYLAGYTSERGKTVHYGPEEFARRLQDLAVDSEALANPALLRYPGIELVILETDAATITAHAQALRAFMEAGGKVLWNRPPLAGFDDARAALGLPVTLQPSTGPAMRADSGSAFVEALAREDLYWLGPVQPVSWHTRPLAEDMTDGVFAPPLPEDSALDLPIDDTVALEGKYVGLRDGGISLATNGQATWPITLDTSGPYLLGIVAGGTPCEGIYPLVEARLDGKRLGFIPVAQREPRGYSVLFDGMAGGHEVNIAFVNDKTSCDEDRNLFVQRVIMAPCTAANQFEALTAPPALVQVPIGKGRLVLNAVRWEDAASNALKARRFITSLLGELGASFHAQRTVSAVEAETLAPNPGISHFSRESDHVRMGSIGSVEGKVRVATSGRYRIGIWAGGSSAQGTYPIVVVTLDGDELGRVECAGPEWSEFAFTTVLPEGEGVLRLAFINDYYDPPDDRNLWIDRVEFEALEAAR